MIWDTFVVDKVVDVSARVLLRLSQHASLYPSHLPYLFLRQMWYLLWKHKMLKMSTREQCQVSNQARGSWLETWFQVLIDCSLSPCLTSKNKAQGKDREKAWYGILLLLTLMIWDTLALVWLVCRGIIRRKKSWVFRETLLRVPSRMWRKVEHFFYLQVCLVVEDGGRHI